MQIQELTQNQTIHIAHKDLNAIDVPSYHCGEHKSSHSMFLLGVHWISHCRTFKYPGASNNTKSIVLTSNATEPKQNTIVRSPLRDPRSQPLGHKHQRN